MNFYFWSDTFLFMVAVIGMTHIVVDSEIMEPVEEWAKDRIPRKIHDALFNCYQCSGYWCGIFLAFLMGEFNPIHLFIYGCAGSFLADFSESVFHYLETKHAS